MVPNDPVPDASGPEPYARVVTGEQIISCTDPVKGLRIGPSKEGCAVCVGESSAYGNLFPKGGNKRVT